MPTKPRLSDLEMAELRTANRVELLEATLLFYSQAGRTSTPFVEGIKLGFKLASPEGWRHVALDWLRRLRGMKKGNEQLVQDRLRGD